MTPTDASVPSSLYSPSSSEPIASVPRLVHPVAGDHAVGGALVLDLEHDALVRLVRAVSGLATTPSSPAPSNSSNQRCAVVRSVVAGVTWIDGPDAGQRVDERGAALAERPLPV